MKAAWLTFVPLGPDTEEDFVDGGFRTALEAGAGAEDDDANVEAPFVEGACFSGSFWFEGFFSSAALGGEERERSVSIMLTMMIREEYEIQKREREEKR